MEDRKFIPEKRFKYFYYRARAVLSYSFEMFFPPKLVNYKEIPIIINNFNRVTTLKKLISSLESRGYNNIYIIDNNSTWPPLLDYYKECPHKVFRLDTNIGTLALWKSGIIRQFRDNFFVYTDSDVMPVEECPDDFMQFFLAKLKKYKLASKVGFSLRIDDIPDHNLQKQSILLHESQFYLFYDKEENLYRAPIGATFALYRPRSGYNHANNYIEIYRSGFPYVAYHLPWYQNSLAPEEEERYYIETAGPRTWYTKASRKYIEKSKT